VALGHRSAVTVSNFPERVVILGAGVAGLSVACALAEGGAAPVVVERATSLGSGASGRNAGLGRQGVKRSAMMRLAAEGLQRYRAMQGGDDGPLVRTRGSLLLHHRGQRLDELAEALNNIGVDARRQRTPPLPWLVGSPSQECLYTPSDASLDAGSILEALRSRTLGLGGRLLLGQAAIEGLVAADGRVSGVRTERGVIDCDAVVDARGAHAAHELFESQIEPPRPRRRHLALCELDAALLPGLDQPWIWDLAGKAYLRPEPGGILACVCDVEEVGPDEGREHPAALEWLAEGFPRSFPSLASLRVRTHWAGLRSFSADGNFVLGPDPWIPGLHWAAAYGGHGMSAGLAAGYAVARALQLGALPAGLEELAADRFLRDPPTHAGGVQGVL
jgi:glycine/D-amino acid oxidase-like deaminating enzyme